MRSFLWLDKHELDIAAGDANDAVRLAPNDARVYSGRGRIRLARREYDAALADFSEAIRHEPRSAGNYGMRGEAAVFRRDQRAIADADEAIRIEPQFRVAFRNRGLAGQALKAVRTGHGRSQQSHPSSIRIAAWFSLVAAVSGRKERVRSALADFERGHPDRPEVSIFVSLSRHGLTEKKAYQKALADYELAIRLDPLDAANHRAKGDLRAAQNKPRQGNH